LYHVKKRNRQGMQCQNPDYSNKITGKTKEVEHFSLLE
jgi:hypothetical protein